MDKVVFFTIGIDPFMYSDGVAKKIAGQCHGVIENGADCDALYVYNNKWFLLDGRSQRMLSFGEMDADAVSPLVHDLRKTYSVIYARNAAGKKIFDAFLKTAHSCGFKVIVELPTFPIVAEQNGKAKQRIQQGKIIPGIRAFAAGYYLQKVALPRLYRYIDRFLIISSDAKLGKVDCVRIENGIDASEIRTASKKRTEDFILIGVASVNYWHGYDRIIQGLAEFYRTPSDRKVFFRIVGDGQAIPQLKELADSLNVAQYVQFVGKKFGCDLNAEFDSASAAVDSLGLHRQKLEKASSLKSREYMARGIPYISTVINGVNKSIPYSCFLVESNEEPICISEILQWYDNIHDIQAVSAEMQKYAADNYLWKAQMAKAFEGIL